MKTTIRRNLLASVIAATIIGAGSLVTPASAADSNLTPLPPTTQSTVELEYIGFDEEAANANGYEIRTDADGVKYSILASTPLDVLEGAIYLPGTNKQEDGEISARGTIPGTCGTATLTGLGQGFFTAYNITDPWLGGPFKHVWRVAVVSNFFYEVYNLDGLANPFRSGWSTNFYYNLPHAWTNGWVSTGEVTGKTGVKCGSLTPSDSWNS